MSDIKFSYISDAVIKFPTLLPRYFATDTFTKSTDAFIYFLCFAFKNIVQ